MRCTRARQCTRQGLTLALLTTTTHTNTVCTTLSNTVYCYSIPHSLHKQQCSCTTPQTTYSVSSSWLVDAVGLFVCAKSVSSSTQSQIMQFHSSASKCSAMTHQQCRHARHWAHTPVPTLHVPPCDYTHRQCILGSGTLQCCDWQRLT